jgi:Tubulin-tyrosine ligase family
MSSRSLSLKDSEAYIRLSSLPYSLERMNYFIHLTNNAVQVKSGSYGSIVEGNIMGVSTFEQLLSHLPQPSTNNSTDPELNKSSGKLLMEELSSIKLEPGYLMQKITEQIKVSFDCCKGLLNPNKREKCFELFGFDFMVDSAKRVWLIECNSVPSLGESNKFLTRFFNRMLGRIMRIAHTQMI